MAGVGAEFGEELRVERERRGISLETLCVRTKVNRRHLDALERGDYKALPGGVFRRGLVRAYLGSVGLEERIWLARFDACYADYAQSAGIKLEPDENAWATFASNVKRNRGAPRRPYLRRWLGVLLMLALLAGAAWAVWHFSLKPQMARPAESKAVASTEGELDDTHLGGVRGGQARENVVAGAVRIGRLGSPGVAAGLRGSVIGCGCMDGAILPAWPEE